MENGRMRPMTLAQMGFCCPQSSSKRSTAKKTAPGSALRHNQRSQRKLHFESLPSAAESDETVFLRPLPAPKTIAELFGKTIVQTPVSSSKKPLPFQNVNETVQKSLRGRASPRNHRNSIATFKLSSVTKNSLKNAKCISVQESNTTGKKQAGSKFSLSKKPASKATVADQVPKTSKMMDVRKSLRFSSVITRSKEQRGHESDSMLTDSMEEITGIMRIQKQPDFYEVTSKAARKKTNEDANSSTTLTGIDVPSSVIKRKGTDSRLRKTPKRLRFDEQLTQSNSLMENLNGTRTNDSFAAHELACDSAEASGPVGVSTPFKHYRSVNDSFDQSLISNPSVGKIAPRIVLNADESSVPINRQDNTVFDNLCEMMEDAHLRPQNPSCLGVLRSARNDILETISALEAKLKIEKEALVHVDDTIRAITESSKVLPFMPSKYRVRKTPTVPKIIPRENDRRKIPISSPARGQRIHKMDLRTQAMRKSLAARAKENISPDPLSKAIYLNLKKKNAFLRTPKNLKINAVLTDYNQSPRSVISSNIQSQLRILYDK